MSVLKYKTIANERPQGKPKVYFSCHPDDFDKFFEKYASMILKLQDCAIKEKFTEAFNEIYDDREAILERCRTILESFEDTEAVETEIREHIRECEIVEELNRKLLDRNAYSKMDQDEFLKTYNGYVKRYESERRKIDRLQKQLDENRKKAEMVSAFMFEIHEREGFIEEFDERLWITTLDTVLAGHDGTLTFRFRNGSEVTK